MATNKERLDALSAKLKETQETLNNKILALNGGEIEIELPEVFANVSTIYHHNVGNNKILLSSTPTNSGLWLYNIDTREIKKIYDDNEYRFSQQIDKHRWFICSNLILIYNNLTDTCEQIADFSGGYTDVAFQAKDNIWMFGSSNSYGMFVYDDILKTVNRLGMTINDIETFIKINDTKLLVTSGMTDSGVWLYSFEDNTLTQIFNIGNLYKYAYKVTDKKWIIIAPKTINGIMVYNEETDECKIIYDKATHITSEYVHKFKDKVFLSGSYAGLIVYDTITDAIELRSELPTYSWNRYKTIKDRCLIGGSVGGSSLWLYDYDSDTITEVISKGSNYLYHEINDRILISATDSGVKGIYIYDYETNLVSQLTTDSYRWTAMTRVSDTKVLIGSASGTGLYIYDYETNAVAKIYSSSSGWTNHKKITNTKYLVGSTAQNGLVRYDLETNTAKSIFGGGGYYDVFKIDGTNCKVSSTNSNSKFILNYNSSEDTAKIIGYKIEV